MRKLVHALTLATLLGCSDKKPTAPPTTYKPPVQQPVDNPPSLSLPCALTVNENSDYSCQPSASDPEGKPITFTMVGHPQWLSFHQSSGFISGKAPEVLADTTYDITVTASDGTKSTPKSFNLTNKNVLNVYLLSQAQVDSTQISDSTITFSTPRNYSAADLIATGITTKTPEGLIKRISSVSLDRKTIKTSQARLEDFVKEGTFSLQKSLIPLSNMQISYLRQGVLPAPTDLNLEGYNFGITLSNVVLWDKDNNLNTTSDQLRANGNINFNADFSFDMRTKDNIMEYLKFQQKLKQSTEVTLSSSALGIASAFEVKVAEYNFGSILLGTIPAVIPIPVIATPKIEVYVTLDPTKMNPLSLNLKETADLTAGIEYKNGNWNNLSSFTTDFSHSFLAPLQGDWDLRVLAGLRLKVPLYGIAGPNASLSAKLGLSSQNFYWKVYGGLVAVLGIDAKIFGKNIFAYANKVLDYEKIIAQKDTTSQPTTLEMLLTTTRDGNAEIYGITLDGTTAKNLTNNLAHDYEATISPDKTKMAFVSERDGRPEIYRMNLDGTGLQRLTTTGGTVFNRAPDWSPNGDEITFYTNRNGNTELFLMGAADGSNQRKISLPFGVHIQPKWCGSSNDLIFASTLSGGGFDIHKIKRDGTGLQRLTTSTAADVEPSCSPDGTKAAFISNRTNNYYYVFTMSAIDGSNQTNLSNTTVGADNYLPYWSPDGSSITYTYGHIDRTASDIWTMKSLDGSNKTRITTRTTGSSNVNSVWIK